MRADLVHALRRIRRSPASALAAIATLALTLGVGASIAAVVQAAVLTPPAFRDPGALVLAGETPLNLPRPVPLPVSAGTFEAWRARASGHAAMEGFDGTNLTLTGLGPAERMNVTDVTPGFFDLLGIEVARGRRFEPRDLAQPVVIVSDAFWRSRLGADPAAIGRTLTLGAVPHVVAGVLPEDFRFELDDAPIWRPLPLTMALAIERGYRVRVIARLSGTGTIETIGSALGEVSRATTPPVRVTLLPMADAISGPASRVLWLLAAAAAIAVLTALLNVAGVVVVRTLDRQRELALRSALGAGQSLLAKQVLIEAQLIVALGALGGILVAFWATPAVGRVALEQFGALAGRPVPVSWTLLATMIALATTCGWLCAWLPGRLAARRSLSDLTHKTVTPARHELALRRLLVASEVALALMLLVSVTLLGRNLQQLRGTNPGFEADGLMTLGLSLPRASYPEDEDVAAFYATLQGALNERLGAGTVSFVDELPLTSNGGRRGVSAGPSAEPHVAIARAAGPGYFDVMRIPVAAGRALDARDDASAPLRVVVSASLADALFASRDVVGRDLWFPGAKTSAQIVGVAGDVTHFTLNEQPQPTVYIPAAQEPSATSRLVIRSAHPDADIVSVARAETARLDPDLPVYGAIAMPAIVNNSLGMPARRLLMRAFAGFATLGLVLGAIGIFGVVAHHVATRRGELAIRVALGANPSRVAGSVFLAGARLVLPGVAAGGLLSYWAARALDSSGLVAGGLDAASVAIAATALIATAGAAVTPAARRALRTDPLLTLRGD